MASAPAPRFIPLTPSEQRLAWLESLKRPLSDEESADLRRCLHNVYCFKRRG